MMRFFYKLYHLYGQFSTIISSNLLACNLHTLFDNLGLYPIFSSIISNICGLYFAFLCVLFCKLAADTILFRFGVIACMLLKEIWKYCKFYYLDPKNPTLSLSAGILDVLGRGQEYIIVGLFRSLSNAYCRLPLMLVVISAIVVGDMSFGEAPFLMQGHEFMEANSYAFPLTMENVPKDPLVIEIPKEIPEQKLFPNIPNENLTKENHQLMVQKQHSAVEIAFLIWLIIGFVLVSEQ